MIILCGVISLAISSLENKGTCSVFFFVLKDTERRRLLLQLKFGGEAKANPLLPFVSDSGSSKDCYF